MKLRSKTLRGERLYQRIAALSKEEIEQAYDGKCSISSLLKKLGFQAHSQSLPLFRERAEQLGITLKFRGERVNSKSNQDIQGQTFGYLTVTNEAARKGGRRHWNCIENETGKTGVVSGQSLVYGRTKSFSFQTKSGTRHKQWTGCGELSGNFWNEIKTKAATRALEFTITIEQAWDLFVKQARTCKLSGLSIEMPKVNKAKRSASLDRINSTKGYTLDNVQWVHKDVNKMKNVHSQEYFIQLCKAVANYNGD